MKKHLYLLFAVLSFIFSSCSSSDESTSNAASDFAPDKATRLEFRLYSKPPRWSVRMIPAEKPTESKVLVNSDTYIIQKAAVYYKKTGAKTASLSTNFWASTVIGSNMISTFNDYELNLTFSSPHQGTYTGTYKNKMDDNTGQKTSGFFAFDTEDDPDFGSISEDTTKNVNDYTVLTKSWKNTSNGISTFITFNSSAKYSIVKSSSDSYTYESGFYTLDKSTNCIYITKDGTSTARKYRITRLDANTLEWQLSNNDVYLATESFSSSATDGTETKPKPSILESDELYTKISQISNIDCYYMIAYTNPSAYTDKSKYLGAGLCYGTKPHPTITDNTTSMTTIRPNSNTYSVFYVSPKTTYYLRPYTENNGVVTYFKETSIHSLGDDIVALLTYQSTNTVKISLKINIEGTFSVALKTWDLNGEYRVTDYGYKQKGGSINDTYKYPLDWRSTRYFYLVVEDIKTGIEYRSNRLYSPNPSE